MEAPTNEAQNFRFSRFGLDAKGVRDNELFEPTLVAREPKEPVSFFDELWQSRVLRTEPRDELVLCVKLLATDAVEPSVRPLVDVAGGHAAAPELVNGRQVSFVAAGVHETVERDAELRGERPEPLRVVADELCRRTALAFGGSHVFQRIVVAAAHQVNVAARLAKEAPEGVDLHELERMPEVRRGVDVWQRRAQKTDSRIRIHGSAPFGLSD